MQNDVKETLSRVAETTIDEPIEIVVDIISPEKRSILGRLFHRGPIPTQRVFQINQITLGNMIRISKILLDIDMNIYDKTDFLNSNYRMIETHGESISRIIAIAVTNKKTEPPKELVDFILWNFSSKELFGVLTKVLEQMNVASFMSSIISMKGLSVLESGGKKSESNEVSP